MSTVERNPDSEAQHDAYWNRTHQQAHHQALLDHIGNPGNSLLDVGCGYGALADLLPETISYIGIDRNPDKILSAQELRPGRDFRTAARLPHADTVVFCGFATIYVKEPRRFLERLWRAANQTLALSADAHYTSHEELLRFTRGLGGRVDFRDHCPEGYPPFWTAVLSR